MNLDSLPSQLRRVKTTRGLMSLWRKTARGIYTPDILQGLPPFAEKLARSFWDVEPSDVIQAIRDGDCPFFVAFLLRLDLIEQAMVDDGRPLKERLGITNARWMIEGFRAAAEQQLVELGGRWPFSAEREPS